MNKEPANNKEIPQVDISSVSEFLDAIQKIKVISLEETLFFRGESKDYGDNAFSPAISRGRSRKREALKYTEYDLYNNVLLSNPDAFEKDKTVFERLVRMQHYGLPTRLLDITSNPLVALYFACKDNESEDGYIHIIKEFSKYIRAYNTEIVEFISNIIPLDTSLKFSLDKLHELYNLLVIWYFVNPRDNYYSSMEECLKNAQESYEDLGFDFGFIEKKLAKFQATEGLAHKKYEDFIAFCFKNNHFELDYNDKREGIYLKLMQNRIFSKLNKNLSDIDLFEKVKSAIELTCIKPSSSNDRLKAQSGYFIFFGELEALEASKKKIIEEQFIIKNKVAILKELDRLGINKLTLFPDLQNACEYYKDKYLTTK